MTMKKGLRAIPFRVFKMPVEQLTAYIKERDGAVQHTHTNHVYKHGDNISAYVSVRNDEWLAELGFEFYETINIVGVEKKPKVTMVI